MSRVIESSGAQLLPPVDGQQYQQLTSWVASLCCNADQRTKHAIYRDLAGVLGVTF